jgi:hypothetical protein
VERRHALGVLAAIWLLAVIPGSLAMRGVHWPYDPDGFRDIAFAQSIRDGGWLSDPYYAGHKAWYSPLVPAVVAFLSKVSGAPVREVFVQAGPWLNALVPLTFFVLVSRLLGYPVALHATVAFLFLSQGDPAWAASTYSPWLFPSVAAQSLLFVSLYWCVRLTETYSPREGTIAGVLVGITFLAHPASALVLAGMLVVTLLTRDSPAGSSIVTRLLLLSLVIGAAALIVLPFMLPLVFTYSLRVLNRAPAVWNELRFARVAAAGSLAAMAVLTAGLLGAGLLVTRDRYRTAARFLVPLGGVTAAGLVYALVAERTPSIPSLVPAHHFFFILKSLGWIALGVGACSLIDYTAKRAGWQTSRLHAGFAIAATVVLFPSYLEREAFTTNVQEAKQFDRPDTRALVAWIRDHTDLTDVFLALPDDALTFVGPAGRRVVSVNEAFSNQYVDHTERAEAQNGMFAALLSGDEVGFLRLGDVYGVRYVLTRPRETRRIRAYQYPRLIESFTMGEFTVFAVTDV